MRKRLAAAVLLTGLIAAVPVSAASLKVAPTSIEVAPADATTTLRLTNTGTRPANVQIRVFRWTQRDGKDALEPTRDVIVSPPQAVLSPGLRQTIRVVRVARTEAHVEESYRVLVDELPRPGMASDGTVSFLLRYSIPVFFAAVREQGDVSWSMRYSKDGYLLKATNHGNTHSKIAGVEVVDAAGRSHQLAEGLVGYVLPGSSMTWRLTPGDKASPAAGPATLRFRSGRGPTDVAIDLGRG
jgi:fimbrial chaperone protein